MNCRRNSSSRRRRFVKFQHTMLQLWVVARHAVKGAADTACLTTHIALLETHLVAIIAAIAADAGNLDLVTKKIEIDEKIASSQDRLLEDIDIDKCMTGEEAKLWDSAHRSY